MNRRSHFLALALISVLSLMFGAACGPNDSATTQDAPFDDQQIKNFNWKIDVALVTKGAEPRIEIKQSFVMPRKQLYLRLPDSYLRQEHLYDRIKGLEVQSPARLLASKDSKILLVLEAPVGETIHLRYQFIPYDVSPGAKQKESFSAPIIRSDYFQFVASMLMVHPLALALAPSFKVELTWSVPSDFKIFNSFGAEQSKQSIVTDFDKVRDAFFVAGKNIRVHKTLVHNQPVFITFEGSWKNISDTAFINTVKSLLETQRSAFNDDNFPYFFVNFLAQDLDCSGTSMKFAGTAHPNSFRAIFPGGRGCVLAPEMRQLISHELMHMWIGKKIRIGEERGHIDGKWFTEGFTDYFGRLLAYRAGVLSEDEFFSSLNRQLEKYFISPEKRTTLSGLVERMYKRSLSTRLLEELPYQQGEIMAWRLNTKIKTTSGFVKGLDDVLKDILADANKAGGYIKLTVKEMASYFDKYIPKDFDDEYKMIVVGDEFIPPDLTNCRSLIKTHHTRFPARGKVSELIYGYDRPDTKCDRWLK